MVSSSSDRRPVTRTRAQRGFNAQVGDRLGVVGEIVQLVWSHKLWWMIPLLIALLLLAVLLTLSSTPVGPLIYPVF
jgi:hypothetical protein